MVEIFQGMIGAEGFGEKVSFNLAVADKFLCVVWCNSLVV